MKKYMFLIVFSLSLLFLLPLDTYAYVDSSWHTPYDSSSVDHYTNYAGYWGTWSSSITGTNASGSSVIYFNNIQMPQGKNDYLEFPVFVYLQPLNVNAWNDTDGDNNANGIETHYYGNTFTFDGEIGTPEGNTSNVLCTLFPSSDFSPNVLSGTLRCNLNALTSSFNYIRVMFNRQGDSTLQEYRVFFGTTGWVNFIPHDADIASNSIVNAQNQTTQAVQEATDAIEAQNDLINDSTTSGANNKGTTFFGNFGNHDNAHLTTIITAPLRLFNAMTTECTQPIQIPIGFNNSTNGAIPTRNIPVACYANFWNRQDVQTFRTFWNLLIGGPCIYGLLVLLMKAYNKALDPLNDALITIDLNSTDKPKSKEEGSDDNV